MSLFNRYMQNFTFTPRQRRVLIFGNTMMRSGNVISIIMRRMRSRWIGAADNI